MVFPEVVTRLQSLRTREHECLVSILEGLVECLRSRVYLDLGHESLWKFLVERLGYSEGAASRRAAAARVVLRCPRALDLLRERRVTLCALALLRPVLDEMSDPDELLARIEGKSRTEVERTVAAVRPVPARRETVRRRFVKPSKPTGNESLFPSTVEAPQSASTVEVVERVGLSFSLDPQAFADFEKAKELLSSKLPAGMTLEQAFNELVRFYTLEEGSRAAHGAPGEADFRGGSADFHRWKCASNRTLPPVEVRSRHVPAALRDEVLLRDGRRCAFVGADGRRCGSRHDLQIDHVRPYALGGTTTAENLRVLCGAHNRHRARRTFSSRVRFRRGP